MRNERFFLAGLSVAIAAAAIAVHVPGQLSYDSSVQVFEAMTGRMAGWSPPFMSALLRWLGGGTVGTSLFVALNSVVTYASLALLVERSERRLGLARTIGLAAILLNPVIFCFVGIIWKDVLFGTWLLCAFALCVSVERMPGSRARIVALYAAIIVIAAGPLIRQQGTLVAPLVLIAPLVMLWTSMPKARRLLAVLAGLALYAVAGQLLNAASTRTIKGDGGQAMSFGPTAIAMFDITGVVVRLPEDEAIRNLPGMTSSDYAQLVSRYTPRNPDFLNDMPSLSAHIVAAGNGAGIPGIWLRLIPKHPWLYAEHRTQVMRALLDIGSQPTCLPIQIGIEGQPHYLAATGFTPGRNARARALYRATSTLFDTPVWQNWFYASALCATFVAAVLAKRLSNRTTVLIFLGATIVFVAAFIPTAIACDFRYLYPVVPTLSGALIVLISRRGKALD